MGYVASDSIRIFPTSNRGAGPVGTNWVTEHNLASIIANLVNNVGDNKGFVVLPNTVDAIKHAVDSDDTIVFYLAGYLISAKASLIIEAAGAANNPATSGKCSFVKFYKDSSENYCAGIEINTNAGDESYSHIAGNDITAESSSQQTTSIKPSASLILLDSDFKIPDSSRINFVHLLLDGGVIGADGSLDIRESGKINNAGTIDNTNGTISGGTITDAILKNIKNGSNIDVDVTLTNSGIISGGKLQSVAITTSSFTGNIGASTLTGDLTATGYSITGGTYSGTVGTLSGGTISGTTLSHVTIDGSGGASSFTGNIGESTLTGELKANSKNITNVGTLSASIITASGSISANTLKGDISEATVKSTTHTADNKNLALAFYIDDGELT